MNDNLNLIIGGTGKTGRRVAERLTAQGHPVRIGSRSGTPPFDWEARDTWAPVLEGVGAAYVTYYPDLSTPGAVAAVGEFAEVAAAHGVQRLVLLSGRGEPTHEAAEKAVQTAGPDWTIVRSGWFAQNFDEGFLTPVAGEIVLPAGDAVEPFVDADDIAAVAVAALTDPRHRGRVYEVSGPRALSFADVAAELSRATGRTITYRPVSKAEYADMLRAEGAPAELAELFEGIVSGRNAEPADGVQEALGRPATDFTVYASRVAATGAWRD
ncbi:NmrA family NAD(P)-binding protein [Streptomyces sp. MC1]|uniref:NAD(P)H-binding protein n=1 Tax=unclassified Streptomyces TaxID=2593676 RepID=UPI0004C8174A|nr:MULTISPECIES: NAD(P)H-binding protein [unclassified Streptomyces]KOV92080.1 NmrA family transcriptional regulator [Streptomyces sp. NRRL WC-3723]MBG7702807.1 NmrA family NAD(P)-binding protein [Streptomyces sp. MC1]